MVHTMPQRQIGGHQEDGQADAGRVAESRAPVDEPLRLRHAIPSCSGMPLVSKDRLMRALQFVETIW
jgi:hypothetical protein